MVAGFTGGLGLSVTGCGADKTIKNNSGSTALVSVSAPFEAVKGIYDYFGATLGVGIKP